ncbi:MAG: cytochrome P450 [Ornithinimicrobium sp.]
MTRPRAVLPAPPRSRLTGHLGRWGTDPLGTLEAGAREGEIFELRLWRRAVVGYSTQWNEAILGDLETFRSRGGLSALSPYLNAGIVQTDPPEHRPARAALNPGFTRSALAALSETMRATITARVPSGDFDAVPWSSSVVRAVLSATFLSSAEVDPVLDRWLGPMERPLPHPFLPRPQRFRAMNARLNDAVATPPPGTLAEVFAAHGGVPEMRVALAAGYDTTAHTLAWLLAHVAADPDLLRPERHEAAIAETLRLYPAGWTGSRRAAHDVTVAGVDIAEGTLVLYSPYLTHRDPVLWPEPTAFRPERFETGRAPAGYWGYIPFAAGPRTCLGRHYAQLLMRTALEVLSEHRLRYTGGDLTPRAGVTLTPVGPLHVNLRAPAGPHRTPTPSSKGRP